MTLNSGEISRMDLYLVILMTQLYWVDIISLFLYYNLFNTITRSLLIKWICCTCEVELSCGLLVTSLAGRFYTELFDLLHRCVFSEKMCFNIRIDLFFAYFQQPLQNFWPLHKLCFVVLLVFFPSFVAFLLSTFNIYIYNINNTDSRIFD